MKKLFVTLTVLSLALAAQATKNATFSIESTNQNEIQIQLEANADVLGLQFDVNYDPSQITLTESDISHMFDGADSRSNMSVYSKVKEPGLARVLMFDLGGQAILDANNQQNVISVSYTSENSNVSTNVTINNIVAAGVHGEEVELTNDVFTFDKSTFKL